MADASAQYVIDMAAKMSGADTTIAQLDELAAELSGAGKGAAAFQDALTKTTSDLNAARAASAAANTALAEGTAEYRLLERAAVQASKAAEKAALKNAGVIPDDMKAKADAAAAAVNEYARKVSKLEDEVTATTAAEKRFASQLENVKRVTGHVDKTLSRSSEELSKLQSGLSSVGGPLGRLGQLALMPAKGFSDLREVMGGTRAAMLVAAVGVGVLAAAVVALTVVVVAGVAAMAMYAVKLADTRRAAALTTEAFNVMNPALAGLDMAGITNDTGVTTDRLRALAKSLTDAKVKASDLPVALRAAALAEAGLGQGGADSFIADIKMAKLTVRDFANETQQKLGDVVARQMLGLEAQGTRLRSNLGTIFGGLDIDSALGGLATLVDLFDENSTSGKALKFLFETIFQPLIDQAQNAAYVIEAFALGFEIGFVKLYIAAKPIIKAIADFFGFDDTSLSDALLTAKNAGEFAAKVFAVLVVVFLGIVAVIGLVVAAFVAVAYVIADIVISAITSAIEVGGFLVDFWRALPGVVGEAITAVGAWFARLPVMVGEAIAAVREWFAGLDLADIGSNLMAGLARGIVAGGAAVLSAITGAVRGAINAAKSLLGISSPSRVFRDIGLDTGAGMVVGVDDSAEDVQRAAEEMITPPAIESPLAMQDIARMATSESPTAFAAPAASAASSTATANLQGATFNFYGVEDAEQAVAQLGEALTRILEGDAASLGGAVAA